MKPKMYEILEVAAEYHLTDQVAPRDLDEDLGSDYSCTAIYLAILSFYPKQFFSNELDELEKSASEFTLSLGLPSINGSQFRSLEKGMMATPESQGARYMWLKLAALVARDLDL